MEFLFQFIFEILLQIVFEGAFDVAFGRIATDWPALRVVLYLGVGAVAGGLSLLVFEDHIIASRGLRYAAGVLVPIAIGYGMALIGNFREKRGKEPRGLEHFFSGWAFAFGFGAVRLAFAA